MGVIKGRILIGLAAATYLAVMGCVVLSSGGKPPGGRRTAATGRCAPAEWRNLEGLPHRGVAIQIQDVGNLEAFTKSIDGIAALGADTVEFVVSARQENGTSSRIFLDLRSSPTAEQLGALLPTPSGRSCGSC